MQAYYFLDIQLCELSKEYRMLMGIKCADFVNLSMITQIESWFVGVFGKLDTKSIAMLSHFHSGTSKDCKNPDGF